jgi:hypothetical protein
MTGQKRQPKKEMSKWAYAFIPASLSIGIALGWALSNFATKKATHTQEKNATDQPQYKYRDRFRGAILAIDNELNALKNAEDRKVLVEVAYRLRDLDLRTKLQKSLNPSALKQVPLFVNMHP